MGPSCGSLALVVVALAAAPATVRGQSAVIEVATPEGGAPARVISCGLLPADLSDPRVPWRPIRCVDGTGTPAPAVVLRRGRRATVRFLAPPSPSGRAVFRCGGGAAAPLPAAVAARTEDGRFVATLDGEDLRGERDGVVAWRGAALRPAGDGLWDGTWSVVEVDPLRATFRWRGVFRARTDPGTPFGVEAFVTWTPPVARLEASFVWVRSRGAGTSCDLGVLVGDAVAVEGRPATAEAIAGDVVGTAAEPAAPDQAQEADDAPDEPRPHRLLLPEPDFAAMVAGFARPVWRPLGVFEGLGAFVPTDAQRGPRALEAADGATLAFGALHGEDWDAGEGRRLDVVLCAAEAGPPCEAAARPLKPATLGALRPARPGNGASDPLKSALDAALVAWRTDPSRGLGWRREDAGDWFMDARRAGNLEWDTTAGLVLRHLAEGAAVDLGQARAAARHLFLRDRDAAHSGLFFQHGVGHRSEIVEPGHHWADGVELLAALDDDPVLSAAVVRLAEDQRAALATVSLKSALPRSVGWGLQALVALHDAAPDGRASKEAILRYRDFLLARQLPEGHFALESMGPEPDALVRTTPFVAGGVLLPALVACEARFPDAEARAAIRRGAAALTRDAFAVVDGRRVLRSSLFHEPTRGRVVKAVGEATGEERALFAAGLAAAGVRGAAAPASTAEVASALALTRKTYIGKEISMLLRAAPAFATP